MEKAPKGNLIDSVIDLYAHRLEIDGGNAWAVNGADITFLVS